jgi:hypothetical protein
MFTIGRPTGARKADMGRYPPESDSLVATDGLPLGPSSHGTGTSAANILRGLP